MKKLLSLLLAAALLAGCTPSYDGPTESAWVITESITEQYSTVTDFVQIERTVYAYDIYGNLAQTVESINGEQCTKTVYTYDEDGNLLTETSYNIRGLFPRRNGRREYTYDDQGRMLSDIADNGSDCRYTYDDAAGQRTTTIDGTVAKVEQFAEDGTVLWEKTFDQNGWVKTEYTYTPGGQYRSMHITDSSGGAYTDHFELDDHGEYIRSWRIEDGVETELYRQEYEYDDQGRMTRLFKVEGGVRRESSRREYLDENGSYTVYRNGQPSRTVLYDEHGHWIENAHYFEGTHEVGYRQRSVYTEIQVSAGKEETP